MVYEIDVNASLAAKRVRAVLEEVKKREKTKDNVMVKHPSVSHIWLVMSREKAKKKGYI